MIRSQKSVYSRPARAAALVALAGAAAWATALPQPPAFAEDSLPAFEKSPRRAPAAKPVAKTEPAAAAPAANPTAGATSGQAAARLAALLPAESALRAKWAIDLQGSTTSALWLPKDKISEVLPFLLLQTANHDLIALNRSTGKAAWWTREASQATGLPFFTPRGIYLVVNSNLLRLEPNSGEVVWRLRLPFPPAGGPVVNEADPDNPIVYLGGLDRSIYALSIYKTTWPSERTTGAVTRADITVDSFQIRIVWRYAAFEQLSSLLAIDQAETDERRIYACDLSGRTYGLSCGASDLGKPQDVWTFRAVGAMVAGPVRASAGLYVPAHDRTLYCLDNYSGRQMWRYPSGNLLDQPITPVRDPYLKKDYVLLKTGAAGPLTLLAAAAPRDADIVEPAWVLPDAEQAVALFAEKENPPEKRAVLAVQNRDGSLSGHYLQSGEKAWSLPAAGFGQFHPQAAEELIYATAEGGKLVGVLELAD